MSLYVIGDLHLGSAIDTLEDQANNKDRAYENVKKKLADSPLTVR